MLKSPYLVFDRPPACVSSEDASLFKAPQMVTGVISGSQNCAHPVQAELLSTSRASAVLWGPEVQHSFPQIPAAAQPGRYALRTPQTKRLCLHQQLRPLSALKRTSSQLAATRGSQQAKPGA